MNLHVIHDGWNVRFRETTNPQLQMTNVDSSPESLRLFLSYHGDTEILSLVFWAQRMAYPDSLDIYQGKSRFFERSFTLEEVSLLSDSWLSQIRDEIMEIDRKETEQLLSACQRRLSELSTSAT